MRKSFDKHWYAWVMVIPTVIVLGVLGEELGLERVGEIVPAIGAEHGAIHLVV